MLKFEKNPSLRSELEYDLGVMLGIATFAASKQLDENVSRGSRSGRKYAKYNYRSSAPGEYPQEQSGEFRSSVNVKIFGKLSFGVGFEALSEDLGRKILYLEESGEGVRRPLYMTMEGRDAQDTFDRMAYEILRSR